VLLAAAVMAAIGQQSDAPGGSVVIRSTTALVQVRVTAQDSSGHFVRDLSKDDFEVRDDGKLQRITTFAADVSAAPASAAGGGAPGAADAAEASANYALVVLDWLNTRYADRIHAQELLVKLLKTFQPKQKVALYVLSHGNSGLRVDFTADTDVLGQVASELDLDLTEMGEDKPGRFDARNGGPAAATVSREAQIFDWTNKVNESLERLRGVAEGLARRPGRKCLIWISEGFPTMIDNSVVPGSQGVEVSFRDEFERMLDRLNRADIAVYAVDAKGLSVTSKSYLATMKEVAERTGGTAFSDRNDLDEGIRLAFEDQQSSYTLGFPVAEQARLGVHELRLKVRRPGVQLRYRESYELVNR
jgi:VWFA-related protein